MMTCAERMRRIRVMNTMKKMYQNNSDRVQKADDGSMTYLDNKGNVMIKASMRKTES